METYVKTLDKALNYFATVSKGKEIGARLSIILDTFFKDIHAEYSTRDMQKIVSQHEGFEEVTKGQISYTLEQLVMCGILGGYGKAEETIIVDYHEYFNERMWDRCSTNNDGSITYHPFGDYSPVTIYNPITKTPLEGERALFEITGKRKVKVVRTYYYLKD